MSTGKKLVMWKLMRWPGVSLPGPTRMTRMADSREGGRPDGRVGKSLTRAGHQYHGLAIVGRRADTNGRAAGRAGGRVITAGGAGHQHDHNMWHPYQDQGRRAGGTSDGGPKPGGRTLPSGRAVIEMGGVGHQQSSYHHHNAHYPHRHQGGQEGGP